MHIYYPNYIINLYKKVKQKTLQEILQQNGIHKSYLMFIFLQDMIQTDRQILYRYLYIQIEKKCKNIQIDRKCIDILINRKCIDIQIDKNV